MPQRPLTVVFVPPLPPAAPCRSVLARALAVGLLGLQRPPAGQQVGAGTLLLDTVRQKGPPPRRLCAAAVPQGPEEYHRYIQLVGDAARRLTPTSQHTHKPQCRPSPLPLHQCFCSKSGGFVLQVMWYTSGCACYGPASDFDHTCIWKSEWPPPPYTCACCVTATSTRVRSGTA